MYWLLGFPAGFKPNLDLAHFFGNSILQLISVWNVVTSQLTQIRTYIIFYLSLVGVLGFSVQIATANDLIFLLSSWLMGVYTVFALMYRHMLQMMRTMFKLFRGRKYNLIR